MNSAAFGEFFQFAKFPPTARWDLTGAERRDNTFWHASWYAAELGGPTAQAAVVPNLIDALNDGIDRLDK